MSQLESLIPTIRNLQDVFATMSDSEKIIQLPQIVVVGIQSAGKSSVIEGIVGQDFLPRGEGIVTRTPLLLHLIHTPANDPRRLNNGSGKILSATAIWATFEHLPGRIFTKFDDVREEIINQTNVLCGTNKGICETPINLKIYSAKVIDLSFVDLPGMTKVPVGEQPADIEYQIQNIVTKYISNENSLILVVTAATADLETSEALKFARIVDKDGKRTLCVLTKLDLMVEGTDAMNTLNGTVIPVKLGIIGVVNRSQAKSDIKREEWLKDEMDFLSNRYPKVAEKHGITYLSKTLNKLLIAHIQEHLPGLKQRIEKLKTTEEQKLKSWGEVVDNGNANAIISDIIEEFSRKFSSVIDGTSNEFNNTELNGGARICSIFHEDFFKDVEKINPTSGLEDKDILMASRNASGVRPPLFIAERCFDNVVKNQICRLEEPCLKCIDSVQEELLKMIQLSGKGLDQLQRFSELSLCINAFVSELISQRIDLTKEFVKNLIKIEAAYINTKSPDLTLNVLSDLLVDVTEEEKEDSTKQSKTADTKISKSPEQTLAKRDKQHAELIKRCIEEYFKIVKKSVQDKVPKAIMEFLINFITENLSKKLYEKFYKCPDIVNLLLESADMAMHRKHAKGRLEKFVEASKIINEIQDIPTV